MAGSRMDTGFQAFRKRLEIGMMFGWPNQRSDCGDCGMSTRSLGFVRSPRCAACSVIWLAPSLSNGAKKNARVNLAFMLQAVLETVECEKNLAIRKIHYVGQDNHSECYLSTTKVLFQRLRSSVLRIFCCRSSHRLFWQLHGLSLFRSRKLCRLRCSRLTFRNMRPC